MHPSIPTRKRFRTEAYHLRILFNQGQTIAQALETVSERGLRQELTLFLYSVELNALVNAARELQALTPEQAEDFETFLKQIAGIVE
ncbi:MAG TPA: hypothetical protein VFV38_32760 [Ktedonobacteraceae bacterium]|nr:hypothetical protein [Ktedonobacteraceae bacterium]